ncbi:MAG: AbrB/MazE/SpoVT family DNA-binding domain-containing protein [Agrobacterium albertimagni]|uniref:Regulator protein of stationary/sporulation gene expression n=2 Tax=Agrobacterium albertimagni TaxID=147266 RepID=K2PCU0_9HYPH|nr:AbrB/MazE/SpoVT family DNA-binding domain-containing protein [Agrobacterium albertimagni]EKF58708.1 regulator protein of stationary/sporulation gene expression [Agrobacterium albertimagni AOL15]
MRVTEKGQVTIPKEIRDRLDIKPGSDVDFVVADTGVMLVKTGDATDAFKDFDAWARSVQGTFDTNGMTADEYVDWLRGPRDDLDHH